MNNEAAAAAAAARAAEQRRQAELARERAAAAARQREEEEAHQRALAQQHAQQEAAHHPAPSQPGHSAALGGTSVTHGATKPPAPPKPVDPVVDKQFNELVVKDGNNKTKLAQDANNLLTQHKYDGGNSKAFEQIDIDAQKAGVLNQTLDLGAGTDGRFAPSRAYAGITAAIKDGQLNGPDMIKSLTADGKNTISQGAASWIAKSSMEQVSSAQQALDSKQQQKDSLDRRLAAELAKIGPGITDSQRQQYITAFQQRNGYAKLQGQIDSAATNLDTTLQQQKPTLDAVLTSGGVKIDGNATGAAADIGGVSQKDVASTSGKAMADLAGTSKAGDALKLGASTLQDKALTAAMVKADPQGFKQNMNAIAEQALPRYGKQLLDAATAKAKASGGKENQQEETKNVFQQLKAELMPFKDSYETLGSGHKLVQAYNAIQGASEGNLKALQALGEEWKHEEVSGAERGFGALGLLFGATDAGSGELKDFGTTAKAFGDSRDGIEALGGALKGLKYIGDGAEKVGDFAGKFAPGVGLVLNALQTGKDLSAVLNAKNLGAGIGSGVSFAGDLLSTVGSALDTTGIGIVPGELLNAAGSIISLIGGGIGAIFGGGGNSQDDETKSILTKNLKFSSQTAGGLVGAQQGVLGQLQQKGMKPGQVDDIVTNYSAITNGNDPYALSNIEDVQHAFGIKDGNFDAMLHTIGAGWQQRLGAGGYKTDQGTAFQNFMQLQENGVTREESDYYAKQAGPVGSAAYNKVWAQMQVGNDRILDAQLTALANQKP